MGQNHGSERRRGPVALAELVGRALDPVTARRGFAVTELTANWAEIVGERYTDCSCPERIIWPRGKANDGKPGTLVVRIEGPRALFFQHETAQIMQRINSFLGQGTIGKLTIVQGPVSAPSTREVPASTSLSPRDRANLETILAPVDGDDLRSALDRLGQAVLAERDKQL